MYLKRNSHFKDVFTASSITKFKKGGSMNAPTHQQDKHVKAIHLRFLRCLRLGARGKIAPINGMQAAIKPHFAQTIGVNGTVLKIQPA